MKKATGPRPVVGENEARTELITSGTGRVRSYDLDGKLLWQFVGMSTIAIPTPFSKFGLLYVASRYVGDKVRRAEKRFLAIFRTQPQSSGFMHSETDSPSDRCTTGIPGLDLVLGGGLSRNRLYLIEGDPGVGKTTLALQFLLEGVRLKEKGLYITLSETRDELEVVAKSHGWSLDKFAIFELSG